MDELKKEIDLIHAKVRRGEELTEEEEGRVEFAFTQFAPAVDDMRAIFEAYKAYQRIAARHKERKRLKRCPKKSMGRFHIGKVEAVVGHAGNSTFFIFSKKK